MSQQELDPIVTMGKMFKNLEHNIKTIILGNFKVKFSCETILGSEYLHRKLQPKSKVEVEFYKYSDKMVASSLLGLIFQLEFLKKTIYGQFLRIGKESYFFTIYS